MIDFMADFRHLIDTASKCKQDFDNWKFFSEQDEQLSAHFHKLSEDYLRLLLIDLCTIFSKSAHDEYSFRSLFRKLLLHLYQETRITENDIMKWYTILCNHEGIIDKIRLLKTQKIEYAPAYEVVLSIWELQKVIFVMEMIVLEICSIQNYEIPAMSIKEHSITEAFRRVEVENQYKKLSKESNADKYGAKLMQKVI